MKQIASTLFLAGCLMLSAVSCDKNNNPPEETPFDKGALLTNLADNEIIPAINDFANKLSTLESSYVQFEGNQSVINFETVRADWKAAYVSWQTIKIYDFGPVRNYGFKGSTGTFPTDTSKIEANILSGSYNLGSVSNADAIGLPSLDFLLYRADAITYFADNNYATYGLDVIQKMVSEVSAIQSAWSSYRATFIASTGTESTSAFSELVNEFNRDYELAKNAKLGIPIGVQSLGVQLPEYIEARYSGYSLELLHASVTSLKSCYSGAGGQGFDDYLLHLERSNLNSEINTNFNDILSRINVLNGTLEEEMASNVSGLDALYTAMQGQVVNLKTDMTSAFGVLITYQDNDGD